MSDRACGVVHVFEDALCPAQMPDTGSPCSLVGEKEGIVDRLLMRCLPRLSGKSVFAGDVVAFKPPPGVDGDLLIRRVAAVEGEEMISDDPEDAAFHLKPGGAH